MNDNYWHYSKELNNYYKNNVDIWDASFKGSFKGSIVKWYDNNLVEKLIENIRTRNDNVIHGKCIFGPAYPTGEIINCDEQFNISEGYVEVLIRNLMIPCIKELANNDLIMSDIVGSIHFKVYDRLDKKISLTNEQNERLANAITDYIKRHAIYSD